MLLVDSLMKNSHHTNTLTSTLYNILRKVQQTRSNLDTDTTKIIVKAAVLSKLDYCSSLLLGSSENTKHGLLSNFQSQEI